MNKNNYLSLLLTMIFIFSLYGEESMVWYDGPNNPRRVYLNPDHIAIIENKEIPTHIKKGLNGKKKSWKVIKKTPKMTIYKLNPSSVSRYSTAGSRDLRELEGYSSPVFSERDGGDPELVPIGGIIVYFKPEVGEKEMESWANEKQLPLPARKLANLKKHNAWVFDLPPGTINLKKAQKLHNDPHVIKVIPKWARGYSLK